MIGDFTSCTEGLHCKGVDECIFPGALFSHSGHDFQGMTSLKLLGDVMPFSVGRDISAPAADSAQGRNSAFNIKLESGVSLVDPHSPVR